MKIIAAASVLLLSLLLSTHALARALPPIENLPNNPIQTVSGKVPTQEHLKRAIMTAAILKNWSLEDKEPGMFLATLDVRGKHKIMVSIKYTPENYSLTYHDSVNMRYTKDGESETIHPNYNRWVQDLRKAIQIELLKL